MDLNALKSYLVELGFEVDHPQLSRFNDALRSAGKLVEETTSGMVKSLLGAGAALTTALTGIATGTVALMDKVSQADLGYQLFARRMFMSTEAARALKIATDALGYSLEDIVWGPPELQERYKALIEYQRGTVMAPDFEKQMRQIRDVRFEFTKLEVAGQYFAMNLVAALSRGLFGDENSLAKNLQKLSRWIQLNGTHLADSLARYLVPVIRDVAAIFTDIFSITKMLTGEFVKFIGVIYGDGKLSQGAVTVDNLGRALDHVADSVRKVFDFLAAHPDLTKILFGAALGSAVGLALGGPGGGVVGAVIGGAGGLGYVAGEKLQQQEAPGSYKGVGLTKEQVQFLIAKVARQIGVDPALAEAIAEQESGFKPSAVNPKSGATGLFQLMPDTARQLGVDPTNPYQNIRGGLTLMKRLLEKYHGDVNRALKDYGGFVTADPSDYIGSVNSRYNRWRRSMAEGSFQPTSLHSRVDVGGITVHIQQPGASKEEVYSAVVKAVEDKMSKQVVRNIVQQSGVFA